MIAIDASSLVAYLSGAAGADVEAAAIALEHRQAALLRAKTLDRGLRARLADSLIAQSCLDHEVELVTRDTEFGHSWFQRSDEADVVLVGPC